MKAAAQLFASAFLPDVWPFPIHFNRFITQVATLQKPWICSLQALPSGLQDKQSNSSGWAQQRDPEGWGMTTGRARL